MYINRKQPSTNGPVIVAAVAFVVTLLLVFGFAIMREPEQLAAAFALPELVTRTPTLIGELDMTATLPPSPTRPPTNTPTPTSTATPMATLEPTDTPYPVVEHFLFGRPVSPDAPGQSPDHTYLYGTTQRGELEVHHGNDFPNPLGTTLLAVANGTIIVAGSDDLPQCGAGGNELCGRGPDYYGNVIILRLDEQYNGQNVYVGYGHARKVYVKAGQHVSEGELIAEAGQEGIALGPHVHIEVRLGAPSYASTRNSILWMRPLPGTGALAGRLQDKGGNLIRSAAISLYVDDADATYLGDTETYSRDQYPAVNSDDVLGENFAYPDLPAGSYIIHAYVGGLVYERRVTIEKGKLSFIVFGG